MTDTHSIAGSLLKALEFAAEKHRDQRRKGVEASPYINHPIQVAEVLTSHADEDDLTTLMAAVLHDTIEDTDTTRADLEKLFGPEVADVVCEVTDDKALPKQERKRLQIEHSPHLSDRAKRIKIADKICNVRDIGARPPADWDNSRRKEYFQWATEVVAGCRGAHEALEAYFDHCVEESMARVSNGG